MRQSVLFVMLCLAGCSDPQAAGDSNFRAALQNWYDAHPICTLLSVNGALPLELRENDRVDGKRASALVAAGLVSVEPVTRVSRFGGKAENWNRYHPTDTGRDAIRKNEDGIGGLELCFARRKIIDIVRYTEPGDAAGITLSRVTYRYEVGDVALWARDAGIAAAFPRIAKVLASGREEATDTLYLTSEGWVHNRAAR